MNITHIIIAMFFVALCLWFFVWKQASKRKRELATYLDKIKDAKTEENLESIRDSLLSWSNKRYLHYENFLFVKHILSEIDKKINAVKK